MRNNISPTVEGGLLVAISVLLGLAAVYLPIIGIVAEFFCAVPITIVTVRHGMRNGFMALSISYILLSIFTGVVTALTISLSFGVGGFVLGCCFVKNFGAVKSFTATFAASFVAQILSVGFFMFVMGIDIAEDEMSMLRDSFNESFAMYESMGVDKATIDEAKRQVEPALELVKFLIPTILLLTSLVATAICYYTTKLIFKKIRLPFPDSMPPFNAWRFPVFFLYLAAFSFIGLYWGGTRHLDLLYTVSINSLVFAMGAGLIQGFSLLSYFADRYNISKFVRRLFFLFVILNLMLIHIVSFTGLFDMVFDYRKKFTKD